jgi:hypothetical protein
LPELKRRIEELEARETALASRVDTGRAPSR